MAEGEARKCNEEKSSSKYYCLAQNSSKTDLIFSLWFMYSPEMRVINVLIYLTGRSTVIRTVLNIWEPPNQEAPLWIKAIVTKCGSFKKNNAFNIQQIKKTNSITYPSINSNVYIYSVLNYWLWSWLVGGWRVQAGVLLLSPRTSSSFCPSLHLFSKESLCAHSLCVLQKVKILNKKRATAINSVFGRKALITFHGTSTDGYTCWSF